jgi:SHS2 domain-containing protein
MSRRFRLLPHTADIRLEVRGKDLPELFSASVDALYSLIVDRRRVRPITSRTFEIPGKEPSEQLFSLLRAALLLFSSDRFLVRNARATMKESGMEMKVAGEPFDASRHTADREIKAVTAHGLTVEKIPGGYVARFIVDV